MARLSPPAPGTARGRRLLVRLVLFSVIKINHLAKVGHSWNPRIAWVSRISVPPLRRVTANPCPFRKLKPAQDRRRTHAPCSARIAQFGQPDMATSQCRFFSRRRDWQISGLVNGRLRGSLGIGGRNASACVAAGGTRLHSTLDCRCTTSPLVADEHSRPSNQLPDLILALTAECG
jgi:hypothetical protein